MRFVLAAGGTGGHIFPALAVAEALREAGHEAVFVGVGKPLEHTLIEAAGFPLEVIPFSPISGKGIGGALMAIAQLPVSLIQAIRLLRAKQIKAVLAFGGYPSFVPTFAAFFSRVPRALHEQNAKVGLANRIMAGFCQRVFAVPGATGFYPKTQAAVVGVPNPVRKAISKVPIWRYPVPPEKFCLVILGGSQGAQSVNSAVLECAMELQAASVTILHQTGTADLERVQSFYAEKGMSEMKAVGFVKDMPEVYAAAHLIVSRAGAMTTAEIATAGRPAVFIPLSLAGDHQKQNITPLLKAGAAECIMQTKNLAADLRKTLLNLVPDRARLQTMAERARSASSLGNERPAEFLARQLIELAS